MKLERQNAGFSQKKFAQILGTTQQRVSEWETNKVEPTLSNIISIIKTLNITFEDLIEND